MIDVSLKDEDASSSMLSSIQIFSLAPVDRAGPTLEWIWPRRGAQMVGLNRFKEILIFIDNKNPKKKGLDSLKREL